MSDSINEHRRRLTGAAKHLSALDLLIMAQCRLDIARYQTAAINKAGYVFSGNVYKQMLIERRRQAHRAIGTMLQAIVLLRKGVFLS